jgi:hypothetical protein
MIDRVFANDNTLKKKKRGFKGKEVTLKKTIFFPNVASTLNINK